MRERSEKRMRIRDTLYLYECVYADRINAVRNGHSTKEIQNQECELLDVQNCFILLVTWIFCHVIGYDMRFQFRFL